MRARVLAAVLVALALPACATESAPSAVVAELRPTDPTASGPHFDATDVVETYGSPGGAFLVHYTRSGRNAVPADDLDATGVPDMVESVGATYDEALAYYESLGFRRPLGDAGTTDDGGDGRFDVYLVDFGTIGDGTFRRDGCTSASHCYGHMAQDEDFDVYPLARRAEAIRILASHELFHAVQAAYDADQPSIFAEGTAVWATESFDPSSTDLEGFSDGYLTMTARSLDVTTTSPTDAISYGAGVVFLFLAERFGDDVIRRLLEDLEDGARGVTDPQWVDTLDTLLRRDEGSSWLAAMEELADWSLYTGSRADPALSFARGDGLALLGMTEVALPYMDDRERIVPSSFQVFFAAPLGRSQMTAAIVPMPGSTDAEDLRVVLARIGSTAVREVVHTTTPTAAPPLTMASGDLFVMMIVRGNDGAAMHVPGVCIGTPSEVETCVDALTLPVDAGVPDAGAPDASVADAGSAVAPSSGCSCRVSRDSPPLALPVLALLCLVLARRRTR